jgi:hypothetical protein
MVYIADANSGLFFTVGPIKGTGVQSWTLPPFLGPCNGTGCQNNASTQTPSITPPGSATPGDTYFVTAVSYDYAAFEAGPPANTSATPAITGANGQADLITAPINGPNTY